MLRSPCTGADQGDRMMIGMAAQERKAAGLQLFRIDFGDLKAQDLRVEKQRTLQIGDLQDNMAETANLETYAGRRALNFSIFQAMATSGFWSKLSPSLSSL